MSTDRFYEIDSDTAFKAQHHVIEAISESIEKHCLTTKDDRAMPEKTK